MFRSPRTRRFGSWLVLAAFALNALWPLISLANPAGSQTWMEICTASGMRQVPAGDDAPAGERSVIKAPQCPLCAPSGATALGAAPAPVRFTFGEGEQAGPVLQVLPAVIPASFSTAQPRAPPAFS